MSSGRRDSESGRVWREHLARWLASGLSVHAFCELQGVAINNTLAERFYSALANVSLADFEPHLSIPK